MCHILALELIPKHLRADKKVTGGLSDFSILCESAAGNDAVHVHMVLKLLIPCMENLDNPGGCPEPPLIRGQFQKCLGAASVQETIQKLLVAVNKRVELMRKREHHMKVGRVYYLRPSMVHPDFFQDCLTVRTVVVTAGVVMNLHMPAVTTLTYVIAQFSRFAVQDGMCSLLLNLRQIMILSRISLVRMFKYLPDFEATHGKHLPDGQRG